MADSSTSKNSIKLNLEKEFSTLENPGNRINVSIILSENNQLMPKCLGPYFGGTGDLSAVLTLLKNAEGSSAAIYSLSIDTSYKTTEIPDIDNQSFEPHYYNMNNNGLVKYENVSDKTTKYILIIGELEKYIDPAAPDPDPAPAPAAADAPAAPAAADKKISLKIKKIIFIVDYDPSSSSVQENITITREDLIIEEFLNLYYIDYFSFDNDKFTQKYTQFINPPALKPGGSTLVKKKKKKAK